MTKKVLIPIVLLFGGLRATAQANGSAESWIGGVSVAAGTTVGSVSQSLYLGSGTAGSDNFQINGTDSVYSQNVWITPVNSGFLTGSGSVVFSNPSAAGGTSSITTIDGNNNPVGVATVAVNNASGVILNNITDPGYGTTSPTGSSAAALYVNGSALNLNVDGANIDLNGNDLSIGSSIPAIVGASVNRLVITDNSITGHIIQQNSGSSFVFPVGIAAGDYTPATIVPAAANTLYVSVTDYDAAIGTGTVTINKPMGMDRAWNIYADAATTPSITLQHNNTLTAGASYVDASDYITQYQGSGSGWSTSKDVDYVGGTTASVATTTVIPLATSSSAATVWLSKTSNNATSLPLSLLSFNASKQGSSALLQWTTAIEINNSGFEIQRSTDGKNWSNIGFVNSLAEGGNSNSALNYSYTDNSPASGINYYRLEQIDLNGNVNYSSVKSLDFGITAQVYPNPATSQLNVTVAASSNYQLIDIIGRTLLTGNLQAGKNIISIGSIPAGTYLLRLSANGSASVFKVIKK